MQNAKQSIKNLVGRYRITHLAYLRYFAYKIKIQLRSIEIESRKLGVKLLSLQDLPPVEVSSYDACHIIGSGWSLAHSLSKAHDTKAFVVGFNFSCLAGLPWDVYFVEFGGSTCIDIARAQVKALDDLVLPHTSRVYFKNLWESKNELSVAKELYGNRVSFIRDIYLKCLNQDYLEDTARSVLAKDDVYLRQYESTIVSCIAYAKLLGFKKIVLHGLDFGGGYFFDLPEFSHNWNYRPPAENKVAYSSSQRSGGKHSTSKGNVGVSSILPFVRKVLNEDNIELYCATEVSPSSNVLPVYNAS
jgi:hypothetical protein